jgi:DNA-directed RNA polymerase subunit H (RpoH/RPB5)
VKNSDYQRKFSILLEKLKIPPNFQYTKMTDNYTQNEDIQDDDTQDENIQEIIKRNIKKMMINRKYKILQENNNRIIAEKENKEKVYVFLDIMYILNISEFKPKITKLDEEKLHHGILICNSSCKPTSAIKTTINNLSQTYKIEIFDTDSIIIDITQHEYSFKHEKCTAKEKKDILSKFQLKDLPGIYDTDAMAMYYGLEKGDLVKITRIEHDQEMITYRVVKNSGKNIG